MANMTTQRSAFKTSGMMLLCTLAAALAGCATREPASRPAASSLEVPAPIAKPAPTASPSAVATPSESRTASPYRCSYTPRGDGGFYKDDGPLEIPEGLDFVPDAQPRPEPLHRFANSPYSVLGLNFTPRRTIGDYEKRGMASWYGRKFHGQKTSSGEVYDMFAMTAAHPTLPIPSYAQVTNVKNGRSVIVRINDRGPFLKGREIDLSFLAACRLGYAEQGRTEVSVRSLRPDEAIAAAPRPLAVLPTPRPSESQRLPITAPNLKGSEVYLQLAAFSSRDNADQFIAHVARELDDDANRLLLQQAGTLFRVRLGPFANRAVALAYAEKLTGGKKLEAVIVR